MFRRKRTPSDRLASPKEVETVLRRVLDRLDPTGRMKLVRLWRDWPEVLGPEIARLARPLAHRGATLILACEDPVAVQELSYFAPQILERVNAHLAGLGVEEVFDKVRFEMLDGRIPLDGYGERQSAPPPPPLDKPRNLGGLMDKIPADSPLGRCYRAYVRMFEQSDATTGDRSRPRRKT